MTYSDLQRLLFQGNRQDKNFVTVTMATVAMVTCTIESRCHGNLTGGIGPENASEMGNEIFLYFQ